MVRATAAEVLKLFAGVYPPGTDATNIGNLCSQADYHMDAYAKANGETSLSTTDTGVVYAANMTVAQLGLRSMWIQAGGPLSGYPEPPVLTNEVKLIIKANIRSSTYGPVAVTDMIDTTSE